MDVVTPPGTRGYAPPAILRHRAHSAARERLLANPTAPERIDRLPPLAYRTRREMPVKTRTSEARPTRIRGRGTAPSEGAPRLPRPAVSATKRRSTAQSKTLAPNPFSALAAAIRGDVDARLERLLNAKVTEARPIGPEFEVLVSAVRDLCMRGGKRLRPALLVAGYRAASATAPLEPALDAGVALELLQAYFLIHDDWMDGDRVRRGGPAVHAMLGRHFRSAELGDRAAILAGDYAAALAAEAVAQIPMAPARLQRVSAAFATMQLDVVAGQQLDLVGKAARVETVYTLKTTAYTVRGPLRMGALLAGASPRLLSAIDRFSEPLGIAFQLRDDLLGAFGDPARTGKPLGTDLKTGKRTLLLELALKQARGPARQLLKGVLGNPAATRSQLARALEAVEQTGAPLRVEARIEELKSAALRALDTAPLAAEGHALLLGAAALLVARQA